MVCLYGLARLFFEHSLHRCTMRVYNPRLRSSTSSRPILISLAPVWGRPRGDPGPHRGTGLRRLFAVGGDLSPRHAQGRSQVRCAEPAGDSGRWALHSPARRDVISSQTRRATGGRPAALNESGGGTGPVKPRQPARLIVKPRGRCQLLRRRLRQMSRRT